ncbi:DUF551 domain-containing protein [Providencia alcalifaciens]|uniref:DUF551 domain-containing protein n=1 Tax=Providencia alcalifaciens TaxID=126385 RepID=UPI0018C506B6|nr:DUF551 domain-containing protein [Providencia alcalifaciens]
MQGTNWVKVSERLPKHREEVILFSNYGVRSGYYDDGRGLKKPVGKWYSGSRLHGGVVTHWMPLPLPPMPEGE